jgi:hypothetical protein
LINAQEEHTMITEFVFLALMDVLSVMMEKLAKNVMRTYSYNPTKTNALKNALKSMSELIRSVKNVIMNIVNTALKIRQLVLNVKKEITYIIKIAFLLAQLVPFPTILPKNVISVLPLAITVLEALLIAMTVLKDMSYYLITPVLINAQIILQILIRNVKNAKMKTVKYVKLI